MQCPLRLRVPMPDGWDREVQAAPSKCGRINIYAEFKVSISAWWRFLLWSKGASAVRLAEEGA